MSKHLVPTLFSSSCKYLFPWKYDLCGVVVLNTLTIGVKNNWQSEWLLSNGRKYDGKKSRKPLSLFLLNNSLSQETANCLIRYDLERKELMRKNIWKLCYEETSRYFSFLLDEEPVSLSFSESGEDDDYSSSSESDSDSSNFTSDEETSDSEDEYYSYDDDISDYDSEEDDLYSDDDYDEETTTSSDSDDDYDDGV